MGAISSTLPTFSNETIMSSPFGASVSPEEYQRRLNSVRRALRQNDLAGLLVYDDVRCGLHISYFCGLDIADDASVQVLLLLDASGNPVLFVPEEYVERAMKVAAFEICDMKYLEARLHIFTMTHRDGKVGMAGMKYAPSDLLERVKCGLGCAGVSQFRSYMLMRLFLFWQRHVYGRNELGLPQCEG